MSVSSERAAERIVEAVETLVELTIRYERRLLWHRDEDRALAKRAARAAQIAKDTARSLADRLEAAERERDEAVGARKTWRDACERKHEKLLAAEARVERLEEALRNVLEIECGWVGNPKMRRNWDAVRDVCVEVLRDEK